MPPPFDPDAVQLRCRLIVPGPIWELDAELLAIAPRTLRHALSGERLSDQTRNEPVSSCEWIGRLSPRHGDRKPTSAADVIAVGRRLRIEAAFTSSVRRGTGPAHLFTQHGTASVVVHHVGPGLEQTDPDDVWILGVGAPPWLPTSSGGAAPGTADVREPRRPPPSGDRLHATNELP